jgi:DNA-binding MarR family transcriptional regulator
MMNDPVRIRQALRSASYEEALAERLRMNVTDLRSLQLVLDEPGMTPGLIAERSGLTTGAVTGVLDRLERAGYVRRTSDPLDRRRQVVQPTAAAEDARPAIGRLDEIIGGLLGAYPAEQQEVIGAFLAAAGAAVDRETNELRAGVRGGFVGRAYRAPLAGATRGRLVFTSGAPRLSLNISPLGPRAAARVIMETAASRLHFEGAAPNGELVGATFDGPLPDVRTTVGTVNVRYQRKALSVVTARQARVALNAAVPWVIELEGGLTDLTGSLAKVTLDRLEVNGGANHIDLELPAPAGTTVVRVHGVVSSARFVRPRGVPIALRVGGGVAHLVVNGRSYSNVGTRRFVSNGFNESPVRLEVDLSGGASRLEVRTR